MDFKHILVPTDFGEPSTRALNLGIDLASKFQAKLTLCHVYEPPRYVYPQVQPIIVDLSTPIEKAAREQLNGTLAYVQRKLPRADAVCRNGVPWREILSVVEEVRPDLVVMGTHGRRGVSHAFLGSVAEKIVRMSPVPVLTMRDTDG